eukprot:3081952-Rhodomonas_salina.2
MHRTREHVREGSLGRVRREHRTCDKGVHPVNDSTAGINGAAAPAQTWGTVDWALSTEEVRESASASPCSALAWLRTAAAVPCASDTTDEALP